MEQSQAYLAEETLGTLMRKYAVPCIISLLVGALCSAWALRCYFPWASVWTACCIPCPCRIC